MPDVLCVLDAKQDSINQTTRNRIAFSDATLSQCVFKETANTHTHTHTHSLRYLMVSAPKHAQAQTNAQNQQFVSEPVQVSELSALHVFHCFRTCAGFGALAS